MTIETLISKLGYVCDLYKKLVQKNLTFFKNIYLNSAKIVYVGGLTTFGVGMLLLGVFPTKNLSLILSISGGIIYATLFTFPFLLVARYHEKGSVRKFF